MFVSAVMKYSAAALVGFTAWPAVAAKLTRETISHEVFISSVRLKINIFERVLTSRKVMNHFVTRTGSFLWLPACLPGCEPLRHRFDVRA